MQDLPICLEFLESAGMELLLKIAIIVAIGLNLIILMDSLCRVEIWGVEYLSLVMTSQYGSS